MAIEYEYDVCLSFAGEQREYVHQVYEELKKNNIHVFYDKDEDIETMLWGRNLIEVFTDVYRKNARFCVMFISKEYVSKVWTKLEKRRVLSRALLEDIYILPVRMDDTEVPGFDDSLSYLDGTIKSPCEIARQIVVKLGKPLTIISEKDAIHQLFCNIQDKLSKYDSEIVAIEGDNNTIKLFVNQDAYDEEEYGAFIQLYKMDIVPCYKLMNVNIFLEHKQILTESEILLLLEKALTYHG